MPRQSREDAGSTAVYVVLRGENPDSAADLAERAVRDNSKSAVNQNNYGIIRLRAGDPKSAEEAFRKAIDLDPSLPGPYYNLAILEKYYVFDDGAASRWFKLYWERSNDDPDRLADLLGKGRPKEIAEQRNER
jgi:Tfp pilus assembly protein PilF